MDVEEFVAQRRTDQDEWADRFAPAAQAAVAGDGELAMEMVERHLAELWAAETDVPLPDFQPLLEQIAASLSLVNEDSSVEATSMWLAVAALNFTSTSAAFSQGKGLEWRTMRDDNVREIHQKAEGQQIRAGEMFEVGGEMLPYPGWPGARPDNYLNCRCVARPVELSLIAAAPSVTDNSLVVVALPPRGHPVEAIGEEQKHVTVLYLGDVEDQAKADEVVAAVESIATSGNLSGGEFPVKGIEPLGDEGAQVWMLDPLDEETMLHTTREWLMGNETVADLYENGDFTKYPDYKPHMTITYGEIPPEAAEVESIPLTRLGVWHGSEHTDHAVGESSLSAGGSMKHWYGILAPEGKPSGDGRMFSAGSLRNRDLPLPLTWQKSTSQGHDNAVVVAKITHLQRVGSEIRAEGDFLDTEDAAQAMALVEEFGRYGVSVDADEAVVGESSQEGVTEFSDARICAAALVHIPAFAEAFVSLGETPTDFFEETEVADEDVAAALEAREVPQEERDRLAEEDKALDDGSFPIANCEDLANAIQAIGRAKDPAKAKAHIARRAEELDCDQELPDTWAAEVEELRRGPGWVTNPEETRRLHAYWTKKGQPGYAKVAWGTPGDFNRCRALVGKEIAENSPEDMRFLDNICAEWHHDALGIWPGEHKGAAATENMAPALSLVASGWSDIDSKYFSRPDFIKGGVNIEGDHTYGYIAEWGVCHISYAGVCTEAPPSPSNYAYFSTGKITCSDGEVVEVGSLTIDTGHAGHHMNARAAAAHYDNTGAVWAYVAVGEDERGIWFSGIVSPSATEEQVKKALAAGRVSGDWRTIGGNLELVAALSVNVAGFPKVAAGLDASGQVSLVAAGMSEPESTDAVELIANRVVEKIESRVEEKRKREERINRLRSRIKEDD